MTRNITRFKGKIIKPLRHATRAKTACNNQEKRIRLPSDL